MKVLLFLTVFASLNVASAATWTTGSASLESNFVPMYFYNASGVDHFNSVAADNLGEKLIMSNQSNQNGWSLVITSYLNRDNVLHNFKKTLLKSDSTLGSDFVCKIFMNTLNDPHMINSGLALRATCADAGDGNSLLEILAYPLN